MQLRNSSRKRELGWRGVYSEGLRNGDVAPEKRPLAERAPAFRTQQRKLQVALLDSPATVLLRTPAGALHLVRNGLIEAIAEVTGATETFAIHELFHFRRNGVTHRKVVKGIKRVHSRDIHPPIARDSAKFVDKEPKGSQ